MVERYDERYAWRYTVRAAHGRNAGANLDRRGEVWRYRRRLPADLRERAGKVEIVLGLGRKPGSIAPKLHGLGLEDMGAWDLMLRASHHQRHGEYEKAIGLYQRAIEASPEWSRACTAIWSSLAEIAGAHLGAVREVRAIPRGSGRRALAQIAPVWQDSFFLRRHPLDAKRASDVRIGRTLLVFPGVPCSPFAR